jgi:soluble lytic murein transglycosylase
VWCVGVLLATASATLAQPALSPSDVAARLATGDAALRRGDAASALGPLEEAATAASPLKGVASLVLGQAQLALGRHEDALASAEAAGPLAPAHGPEVAWLRAQALAGARRAEAADALLALSSDDDLDDQRRAQALVRAAELLESGGRLADASKAWRRAAFEAPATAPADALDRSARLAAQAGVPAAPLDAATRLKLATALRKAQLHARAVAELQRAEKGLSGRELVGAKVARARSHFDLRENAEAREACGEVLRLAPGTEAAADCRLVAARAAWRTNDGESVLRHVSAVVSDARMRARDARVELRLIEGNYHLEQGRLEPAITAFRALLAEHPKSGKAGEARWRIAWARMHQGRPADAAVEFGRLATEQAGGELERIGALWQAIALKRAGEPSLEALKSVARRWPWTYQGSQARELLAAELPAEELAAERAAWEASGTEFRSPGEPELAGEGGTRYALLRESGLHRWALPEIEALRAGRQASDAFTFELARARARAGRASEAHALLRSRFASALDRPSRRSPRAFWEVAYPLPLPDLLRREAAEHGIDPALAAAITRSESAWDPAARSWADARGLMQLVPATAGKLAKAEGMADFDPQSLFDPEVNVSLGARHLGDLVTLFGGDLDAAIASYNAGEDKVAAWWAGFEKEGVPAMDRVERIPYRETRQYVRRVREALDWYAWLFSETAP